MRPMPYLAALAALLLFAGCGGGRRDYAVRGAGLIDDGKADESVTFDVIAYPLNEDELNFFLERLPRVEAAIAQRKATWVAIQTSENPIQAIRRHSVWRDADVSGEDFMAAFIKINFIYEYLQDPMSETDAQSNLARLEGKLRLGKGDDELKLATQSLKFMTEVVEAYRVSGAFDLYAQRKAAIDAAVERFKASGEEQENP